VRSLNKTGMKPPLILFPNEPFSPGRIDPDFAAELEAARTIGFPTGFYDHEAVVGRRMGEALRRLPETQEGQRLILRGWMLPEEHYASLHDAVLSRGYLPWTAPECYSQAHYLPLAYAITKGHTSRSEWIVGDDADAAWQMYQNFRDADAIIKDWVKSAKARWKEGCFIPAHTSEEAFREIYRVFREERGKLFNRGVVLREFLPIMELGSDIGGLPLIEETRLFFWRGRLIAPPDAKFPSPLDELNRWETIARKFSSPFITIDVARLTGGTWKIIETGDGGVSGLPMWLVPERFYACLWNHVMEER
jgi:hypothetical protein